MSPRFRRRRTAPPSAASPEHARPQIEPPVGMPDFRRPDPPIWRQPPNTMLVGSTWPASPVPTAPPAPAPLESPPPVAPAPPVPRVPPAPPVETPPIYSRVRPPRRPSPLAGCLVVVAVFVLVVVVGIVVSVLTMGTRTPSPRPPVTQKETAPVEWATTAGQLRPELSSPTVVGSIDGTIDSPMVVDAGVAWVLLTSNSRDVDIAAHGLDPATGRELWRLPMANGLCAPQLLEGSLVCAASVRRDASTDTVSRWRVQLIDPATGKVRRSAEVDAYATIVAVADGRILLLEQRPPAPHALITALTPELKRAFQLDLGAEKLALDMFSDNRITVRHNSPPDGPALDRPRVRTVADGLTALWVGGATAFVDVGKGRLVGLEHCSRLVDDGARLWCNQPDHSQAFDYLLKPGPRTERGIRLAFPDTDPRDPDVSPAMFMDAGGRLMKVDPETGRTEGVLLGTATGQAFGLTIYPDVQSSGGVLLVSDREVSASVDAASGSLLWRRNPLKSGQVLRFGDRLVVGDFNLEVWDVASGATVAAYRNPGGYELAAFGDQLLSVGGDDIALLDLP